MKRHFPEEKVNTRTTPDTMNEHLRGTWCNVRNDIARDQDGIARSLDAIKSAKSQIRWLKKRIVVNLHALDALETVR